MRKVKQEPCSTVFLFSTKFLKFIQFHCYFCGSWEHQKREGGLQWLLEEEWSRQVLTFFFVCLFVLACQQLNILADFCAEWPVKVVLANTSFCSKGREELKQRTQSRCLCPVPSAFGPATQTSLCRQIPLIWWPGKKWSRVELPKPYPLIVHMLNRVIKSTIEKVDNSSIELPPRVLRTAWSSIQHLRKKWKKEESRR